MKPVFRNKPMIPTVHRYTAARLKCGSQNLLTQKEAVVASYLLSDCTAQDIARLLYRSQSTIKMHIRNLKRKCDCETPTRLGAVLQDFLKNSPVDVSNLDKSVETYF